MTRHLKRIVSIVVSLILIICSASFLCFAESSQVNFVASTVGLDSTKQTFVAQESFKSGEVVYLKITTTTISNLGALAFTVSYDASALNFERSKSSCLIGTEKSILQYYLDTANSCLKVVYDTNSYNTATNTSGTIFYLAFSTNELTANGNFDFNIKILELYDNSSAMNDISSNVEFSTTALISVEGIPNETLNLFKKLKTIVYPDSKNDIDAGLAAFALLTEQQQVLLKDKYPNEYEWVTTATYRFNRASEQVSQAAIQSEINSFKTTYADVLALTEKTVTVDYKKKVSEALEAWENCSTVAKSNLQNEKKLLTALNSKIKKLLEVEEEVVEFLNDASYQAVANRKILNDNLKKEYNLYLTDLTIALLNYDFLSSEAKSKLTVEYEWLTTLKKTIDKYIADEAADAGLTEKVVNFTKAYLYAFNLNEATVQISDKGAIKMVKEAYQLLTDEELKAALASRMEKFEFMLELIAEMEEDLQKDDTPEAPETVVDTEKPTQSEPQIQTQIQTVIQTQTQTQTETKTETVTKTVTNSLEKIFKKGTKINNTILILFLLLIIAVAIHIMVYIACYFYKKKQNEIENFIAMEQEVKE